MEEILASIRKIISEDNPDAAPAAAPAPVAAVQPAPVVQEVAEEDDSEVLELTQEVAPPPPRPEPAPAPEPPPVVQAKPDEIVFEPIPQRETADSGDSGIFSDRTRQAMADTFDSIPDEPTEAEPQRYQPQPSMAAGAGSSVESVFERAVRESFEPVLQQYLADNSQVVIERMKPLIREWMDEKFPALLENAVRGEVEKIVKARTKR
jgi:hypothetical protein